MVTNYTSTYLSPNEGEMNMPPKWIGGSSNQLESHAELFYILLVWFIKVFKDAYYEFVIKYLQTLFTKNFGFDY